MLFWVFAFFIVLNIIAYFIPKRLSKIENYATTLFSLLFGICVDLILNLKYELYGYFGKGFQWMGFIGEFLYFIPISILYHNYLPIGDSKKKLLIYIFSWSLCSVIIEWIIEKTEFFNYSEWNLFHSALVYPIVFAILYLQLKYIRKLIKKDD